MTDDYINVRQESPIVKARSPIQLHSAFSTCTVVAAYDPQTTTGYMLHRDLIQKSPHGHGLPELVEQLNREVSDISRLSLFVSGNARLSDLRRLGNPGEHDKERDSNQEFVEEIISEFFYDNQVKYEWLNYDETASLKLHTLTGEFEFRRGYKCKGHVLDIGQRAPLIKFF